MSFLSADVCQPQNSKLCIIVNNLAGLLLFLMLMLLKKANNFD